MGSGMDRGNGRRYSDAHVASAELTTLLTAALEDNLTVAFGSPCRVAVERIESPLFEAVLSGSPRGRTLRIFRRSERYEAIFVLPEATLTTGRGEYAAAHDKEAPASVDARFLSALAGNIGRLFALEAGEDPSRWVEGAVFSLPADYSPENLAELLWRAAEYRCHRVRASFGDFFILVEDSVAGALEERLESDGGFRDRAAEVVLSAYIGGEERVAEEGRHLSVLVRKDRDFVLGPFLFPRHVAVGNRRSDARYRRIAVGEVFPDSGILVSVDFRVDGIAQTLHYVFPALRNREDHKRLARSLVRQAMSAVRRRLAGFAGVDLGQARIADVFRWDEYMFVLQVDLPLGEQNLPLWVYASIEYVHLLYELLGAPKAWDIRKKSLFTMMLTIMNLNQHVYGAAAARGSLAGATARGGDAARGQVVLMRDILAMLPDAQASRLLHSLLISRLAYSGSELRRLFYFAGTKEGQGPATRPVPRLDAGRLVALLPRTAREDFIGSRACAESWDSLLDRNEAALQALFELRLGGSVEMPARLRIFLDGRFLPEHNAEQLSRIHAFLAEQRPVERLGALPRAEAQNRLLALKTETLALALLSDERLASAVPGLVNRRYREEIEYHLRRLRDRRASGSLDLALVVDALAQLTRGLPDSRKPT